MGIKSQTQSTAWWLFVLILASCFPNNHFVSAQHLKTSGLKRVETAAFVFYVPRGYEPLPPGETLYMYSNKSRDTINVSWFGYLAGKNLDQELCSDLARKFDQSELRTKMHASEAKEIDFRFEDGTRSCYYWYEFPIGNGKARLEYKVYQRENQAYAITAVYRGKSPEQAALQKALHSFTIKKGAAFPSTSSAQIPDPVDPDLVLVDHSKRAYAVFIAVARNTPDEELQALRSQVAQQENTELVPWGEFLKERRKLLDSRILKDEYPGSKVAEGIVELLRRYAGAPFGLTWNGGVAFTFNDYRYVERTYKAYLADPDAYARTRPKDSRADPVNPRAHLGPLLGW